MLFVQHWFNLTNEACEEALLDSVALRRFVGIDLGRERVPDGATLLKFRRRLEPHKLGERPFAAVGQVLQERGLKLGSGTIVDATIIGAPSSTKNADKARDPEMHQTRKGQQWYFGMKLQHIGVDSRSGLAHSAVVTAANVHDKHPIPQRPHGAERRVYGDSAYAWQKALIASKACAARDFTHQRSRSCGHVDEAVRAKNRTKSRVRARVEHVFGVVKRPWGFNKVRYRGLAKNATRSFVALALALALANIFLARDEHCMDKDGAHSEPMARGEAEKIPHGSAMRDQTAAQLSNCPGFRRLGEVATGWRATATCSAFPESATEPVPNLTFFAPRLEKGMLIG